MQRCSEKDSAIISLVRDIGYIPSSPLKGVEKERFNQAVLQAQLHHGVAVLKGMSHESEEDV